MANEVTRGTELNSYRGDPNLGTGAGAGYAKADLSPINTYAAYAYQSHLQDYQQQQKDKAKIEELYSDPKLYVQLDKQYADQINPVLDQVKDLGKKNLQMDPNGDNWYKFMDAHNQALKGNAQLKSVQDIKNQYKKLAGETADIHEKERMNEYVAQLDNYKLGEEIPAYNKYFKYNDAHVPVGLKQTGTKQEVLPNGNIVTKRFSIFNPSGLDVKAAQTLVTDPTSAQTYSDIAHTFQQAGDLETINAANKDAYDKSMRLNMGELQNKYQKEFSAYLKQFPGKTFGDFMRYNGRDAELKQVQDGNSYLSNPVVFVDASKDPKDLAGYTYYTDPATSRKTRLNVPDYVLGAMMGATKNVPGTTDEVIDEKVGLTPKDKFEAQQRLEIEREGNAQRERESQREDATKRYIAGLKDYTDGTSKTAPELPMTPLPSIMAGVGGYNKRVGISTLPVSQIAAIHPDWVDAKGVLKPEFSKYEISIGKREDGNDGVFIYGKKDSKQVRETVNESKLKSNAESWLATFAKERKGQEVYGYIQDLYEKAKSNVVTPPAATTTKTFDIIDPTTGEVLLSGVSEEKAKAAEAKGYKRK